MNSNILTLFSIVMWFSLSYAADYKDVHVGDNDFDAQIYAKHTARFRGYNDRKDQKRMRDLAVAQAIKNGPLQKDIVKDKKEEEDAMALPDLMACWRGIVKFFYHKNED